MTARYKSVETKYMEELTGCCARCGRSIGGLF